MFIRVDSICVLNQTMAWIEDALSSPQIPWSVDDLFTFDSEGRVMSCCANHNEGGHTEKLIFIRGQTCNHELGKPISYQQWKDAMKEKFEEQWPEQLEEEAFFRPIDEMPGGHDLLQRTNIRKRQRKKKFHRPRE